MTAETSPATLPPAPWMTADSTRAVIAALEAAGGAGVARFVGGCVRDTLLGRAGEGLDIDIATALTPPAVMAGGQGGGAEARGDRRRTRHRHRGRPRAALRGHHPAPGRGDRRPPRGGRLHHRLGRGRRAARLPASTRCTPSRTGGCTTPPAAASPTGSQAGWCSWESPSGASLRTTCASCASSASGAWYGQGAPDAAGLAACAARAEGLGRAVGRAGERRRR